MLGGGGVDTSPGRPGEASDSASAAALSLRSISAARADAKQYNLFDLRRSNAYDLSIGPKPRFSLSIEVPL
jgi:hypothetical protein